MPRQSSSWLSTYFWRLRYDAVPLFLLESMDERAPLFWYSLGYLPYWNLLYLSSVPAHGLIAVCDFSVALFFLFAEWARPQATRSSTESWSISFVTFKLSLSISSQLWLVISCSSLVPRSWSDSLAEFLTVLTYSPSSSVYWESTACLLRDCWPLLLLLPYIMP